mmetsp:Transcript_15930/g.41171  ORF Transcript_15930/g.41171 Transcript_15930/m.41171 type:complete len:244 (-) Transcript_15930:686-1417(-)
MRSELFQKIRSSVRSRIGAPNFGAPSHITPAVSSTMQAAGLGQPRKFRDGSPGTAALSARPGIEGLCLQSQLSPKPSSTAPMRDNTSPTCCGGGRRPGSCGPRGVALPTSTRLRFGRCIASAASSSWTRCRSRSHSSSSLPLPPLGAAGCAWGQAECALRVLRALRGVRSVGPPKTANPLPLGLREGTLASGPGPASAAGGSSKSSSQAPPWSSSTPGDGAPWRSLLKPSTRRCVAAACSTSM